MAAPSNKLEETNRFRYGHHELEYLLQLPPGYGAWPAERWPIILFLHGAGERGRALARVRTHGIPRIAAEWEDFPFIAVSPQCPPQQWWVQLTPLLWELIEHLTATLAANPERRYLTGMSMGGYGVWRLAAEHPDEFAAMAPVCGGGDLEWAARLSRLPTWAFHGTDDRVVPATESIRMVRALEALGAPVQLTLYPGVGHDSWTQTYAKPELYEWFLRHQCPPSNRCSR